jgi:hypothetical protein
MLLDMKYRVLITLFYLSIVGNTFAQQPDLIENESQNFLVGKYERADLQKGSFSKYFFEEYNQYFPDKEILENLKKSIFNKSITIVLGTWCADSREQVPRFFKILDQIDYNTNFIQIICVYKNKTAGSTDISGLKIEKVPTFIFYHNGSEIGRIIETPELTLERDILTIIKIR